MMLHVVVSSALQQAVAERFSAEDDVVLQQGAEWAAFSGHVDNATVLRLLADGCRVYVLQESLQADGIENERLLAGIEIIDMSGLVDLTVKNRVIHTWC